MKNHVIVDKKILQTNKKWAHLKEQQKEFILNLFKNEYKLFGERFSRPPSKIEKQEILNIVYEKIKEKEIWIPLVEVNKFFLSKEKRLNKLISNT